MTTIFEHIIAGDLPAAFVHVDEACVAFMDISPMSPGHVLVVPRLVVATLEELDAATRAHLLDVAVRVGAGQRRALGSVAQHLLVNDGKGASQTVPHVHLHVVPRYPGDMLKTVGHIIWHVASLTFPKKVSERRRRELAGQAQAIRQAMEAAHG